jgi:hypothetical protein
MPLGLGDWFVINTGDKVLGFTPHSANGDVVGKIVQAGRRRVQRTRRDAARAQEAPSPGSTGGAWCCNAAWRGRSKFTRLGEHPPRQGNGDARTALSSATGRESRSTKARVALSSGGPSRGATPPGVSEINARPDTTTLLCAAGTETRRANLLLAL